MKTRIVMLLVGLTCAIGALVTYAYSAELAATAETIERHVEEATAALPGWTETGYALYAD